MDIHTEGIAKTNTVKEKSRPSSPMRSWKIFGSGALIGAIALASILYVWNPRLFVTTTPEQKAVAAAQAIVNNVSKLMILPTGEIPTVLDINDPKALVAQQQFFAGAVAGDKLLVYKAAARAIIYSPSRNIIVNVGPITNPQPPAAQPVAPTTTPKKK